MSVHKHDARIDELAGSISDCKRALAALEAEHQRLRNERAVDLCEFKRGDRVIAAGKEYEVSRVVADWSTQPQIYAWNVLKNGSAGNRETKLYSFQELQRKVA